ALGRGALCGLPEGAASRLAAAGMEGGGGRYAGQEATNVCGLYLRRNGGDLAVLGPLSDDDPGRDRRPDGDGAAQSDGCRVQGGQDPRELPLVHAARPAIRALGGSGAERDLPPDLGLDLG